MESNLLTDDLLEDIFAQLDFPFQRQLRRSCRRWSRLLQSVHVRRVMIFYIPVPVKEANIESMKHAIHDAAPHAQTVLIKRQPDIYGSGDQYYPGRTTDILDLFDGLPGPDRRLILKNSYDIDDSYTLIRVMKSAFGSLTLLHMNFNHEAVFDVLQTVELPGPLVRSFPTHTYYCYGSRFLEIYSICSKPRYMHWTATATSQELWTAFFHLIVDQLPEPNPDDTQATAAQILPRDQVEARGILLEILAPFQPDYCLPRDQDLRTLDYSQFSSVVCLLFCGWLWDVGYSPDPLRTHPSRQGYQKGADFSLVSDDCLQAILSQLDFVRQFNLRSVCRKWDLLLRTEPVLRNMKFLVPVAVTPNRHTQLRNAIREAAPLIQVVLVKTPYCHGWQMSFNEIAFHANAVLDMFHGLPSLHRRLILQDIHFHEPFANALVRGSTTAFGIVELRNIWFQPGDVTAIFAATTSPTVMRVIDFGLLGYIDLVGCHIKERGGVDGAPEMWQWLRQLTVDHMPLLTAEKLQETRDSVLSRDPAVARRVIMELLAEFQPDMQLTPDQDLSAFSYSSLSPVTVAILSCWNGTDLISQEAD